jgi:hypothetical protein
MARSLDQIAALVGPKKKRVKARNVARHESEWIRAYGSEERVTWVNAQPCLVKSDECAGKMENAHIKTAGIGMKADAEFIVPLCRHHHRGELHIIGVKSFEAKHDVDLSASAAKTQRAWEAFSGAAS